MSGHLSKSKDRAPQLALDSQEPLPTAWEEEHEADCFGVSLILQVQNTSRDRERESALGIYRRGCIFRYTQCYRKCSSASGDSVSSTGHKTPREIAASFTGEFPWSRGGVFRQRAEPFGELLDDLAVRLGACENYALRFYPHAVRRTARIEARWRCVPVCSRTRASPSRFSYTDR